MARFTFVSFSLMTDNITLTPCICHVFMYFNISTEELFFGLFINDQNGIFCSILDMYNETFLCCSLTEKL